MTNKPMLSVEREPVAWAVEISGCLKFFEQKKSAENARRRYEKVMDAERMEPFPLFSEHPEPAADHAQCEECKGWGYHENHYEGGGTECGECGGSGNATVAVAQSEFEPDAICLEYDGCPTEGAVLKRFWRENQPDPVLCEFYETEDFPSLVRDLVGHVAQLQEAAKRNVKPWEDTFPPTLLPAYIARINAEYPAPVSALITDEQILEAMRQSIASADGGYVVDTAPQDVIAAGRALLAEVSRLNGVKP